MSTIRDCSIIPGERNEEAQTRKRKHAGGIHERYSEFTSGAYTGIMVHPQRRKETNALVISGRQRDRYLYFKYGGCAHTSICTPFMQSSYSTLCSLRVNPARPNAGVGLFVGRMGQYYCAYRYKSSFGHLRPRACLRRGSKYHTVSRRTLVRHRSDRGRSPPSAPLGGPTPPTNEDNTAYYGGVDDISGGVCIRRNRHIGATHHSPTTAQTTLRKAPRGMGGSRGEHLFQLQKCRLQALQAGGAGPRFPGMRHILAKVNHTCRTSCGPRLAGGSATTLGEECLLPNLSTFVPALYLPTVLLRSKSLGRLGKVGGAGAGRAEVGRLAIFPQQYIHHIVFCCGNLSHG